MDKNIACCGIDCSECDTYKVTQSGNEQEKERLAIKTNEQFKTNYTAADMYCNGCHSDDKGAFTYCHTCAMRLCCHSKNLDNCAQCPDYSCDKTETFFTGFYPGARDLLDALRK